MLDYANSRPGAIVVGLDCITGLQAARALHRRGVRVTGIAFDKGHFATRTRCVSKVVHAKRSGTGLIDCLRSLATSDRPVLVPATDSSVLCVAQHGDQLSQHFRLANPSGESIMLALGKIPFSLHAAAHGIPIPRTRTVDSLAGTRRAAAELSAPFVLKPDIKTERWSTHAGAKVFVAKDEMALERIYERCREWSDRFVVQEWIEGGDDAMYSYYAFLGEDGRIVAECVGHKIRQWPRLTGSGTLSEFCDDPEIREAGRTLLETLHHRGFATINMKRDARTGRLTVIEANLGRPGMGMFVAEAAGIEMTYLAYRSLAGESLPPPPAARFPNARWVCVKRDLAAALAAWRQGELGLVEYLRSMRDVRRCAVLDLRDPLPFLFDVMRLSEQLVRRRQNKTTVGHPSATRRPESNR